MADELSDLKTETKFEQEIRNSLDEINQTTKEAIKIISAISTEPAQIG